MAADAPYRIGGTRAGGADAVRRVCGELDRRAAGDGGGVDHIWTLVRSIVPPPPPVSVPLPWKTTPLAFTVGPPWMLNGRPASLQ